MKQEELKIYLQSLEDYLLSKEFSKISTTSTMNTYNKRYGFDKNVVIDISLNNQHVYLKDNKDRSFVCMYNGDVNGILSMKYLELLLKIIYWNEANI